MLLPCAGSPLIWEVAGDALGDWGAEGLSSSVGAPGGDQNWGREWLCSVGGSLPLWAPESLMYNRRRIALSSLEPRLLVSADNYGWSAFFAPRTQQ